LPKSKWEATGDPIDLNTTDERANLIINIGHVVPHEVLGFANHNKNYIIGLWQRSLSVPPTWRQLSADENNLGKMITRCARALIGPRALSDDCPTFSCSGHASGRRVGSSTPDCMWAMI
jgi:hypothetical protein